MSFVVAETISDKHLNIRLVLIHVRLIINEFP